MFDVVKVFFLALTIDVMWVLYIMTTSKKRKLLAALISMMMGAPAIFGLLEIVQNVWMSIPYLLGLGCGTLLGMWVSDMILEKKDEL